MEFKTGYKTPITIQTKTPTTITGILPTVSAILPEKGLDKPAVTVNKLIISPLYSAPPKEVK